MHPLFVVAIIWPACILTVLLCVIVPPLGFVAFGALVAWGVTWPHRERRRKERESNEYFRQFGIRP